MRGSARDRHVGRNDVADRVPHAGAGTCTSGGGLAASRIVPSVRVRAVVQRVSSAAVTVAGEEVGRIGRGLCVLLGVTHTDDDTVAGRSPTGSGTCACSTTTPA